MEKWPVFHQNHGLTPLEKSQFFDFYNLLFLWRRKGFLVLEYRKTHFPGLYCLRKEDAKMAIFLQKPWVDPFRKMAIFDFSNLLFLKPREGFFRSKISCKTHCCSLYFPQKTMEKSPFFHQNHGLTPLKKISIFRLC